MTLPERTPIFEVPTLHGNDPASTEMTSRNWTPIFEVPPSTEMTCVTGNGPSGTGHLLLRCTLHGKERTYASRKCPSPELTPIFEVPRLNGGKMGVLATRSPHRPVPIGLSVAQVIYVEGNCVILGGADIVDGSPVLDIKPYLPFCDGVKDATAPAWVAAEADGKPLKVSAIEMAEGADAMAEAEDEPLKVSTVKMAEGADAMVRQCWEGLRSNQSLFCSSDDFLALVREVLSRDIRSVRRRLPPTTWTDNASPEPSMYDSVHPVGCYHVVLERIDVSYDIGEDGSVLIRGATPNVVQSAQRGLGALQTGDNA
eukprot:gene14442-20450_t